MTKKIKKAIATALASVILASIFTTVPASCYELTGNRIIAEGRASINEAIWFNLNDLIETSGLGPSENLSLWSYTTAACEGDEYAMAETALEDLIGMPLDAYAKANGGSTFLTLLKESIFCVYAWTDLWEAHLDLATAKREEYEAYCNRYFKCNVNACIGMAKAVIKRANTGSDMSEEEFITAQSYLLGIFDDCYQLRVDSHHKYKKYEKELTKMADVLETLLMKTNLRQIYSEAIEEKKKHNNTYACFEYCTTSSNIFVLSSILREKGYATTQNDIVNALGRYPSWATAERTLGLDDGGSFTELYGLDSKTILARISSVFSKGNSSVVIKLLPIPQDNYQSYVLARVINSEIKILDPWGPGSFETVSEYAARNGYNTNTFYGRLSCTWSYV